MDGHSLSETEQVIPSLDVVDMAWRCGRGCMLVMMVVAVRFLVGRVRYPPKVHRVHQNIGSRLRCHQWRW